MTNQDMVEDYQMQVDDQIIEVILVEDYDVPQGEMFVQGFFNMYFKEDGELTPITVEFIVNTNADIDLTSEELDNIDKEFVRTVNHEMVHLEQWKEGRFIENWDGEYMDNPNEIEAYDREGDGSLFLNNNNTEK